MDNEHIMWVFTIYYLVAPLWPLIGKWVNWIQLRYVLEISNNYIIFFLSLPNRYWSTFQCELTLLYWCFNFIRKVHNLFWALTLWFAGIGVDDMFVVVGSYQSLSHHELSLPLAQRMGKLLRHAGVSILVTSVTDIMAFGIGATTVSVSLF